MSNYNCGKFCEEKVKGAKTRSISGHVLIGMVRIGFLQDQAGRLGFGGPRGGGPNKVGPGVARVSEAT